ncbi:hypothetical protein [Actinomycetospora termitidis]|uniref:Uncharacterized protein n=1 Tax=Actinomycetospora termitidis TaxID=3053470 RepID=A0ABT7MFI5_9PSEU|nr:hypothetical protein [Actinomycetospora sp. Odt1-22]MDL5159424.1 hypothetical protein [Actinomycetospora sp. Odt1-22]
MTLAYAQDLCKAVRMRWPSAKVAPGQVTADGGGRPAKVLGRPRPCDDCGTFVVPLKRPGRIAGRWYQLGGHEVKPNGWSRVSYLNHNAARCRAALLGNPLMLPEVSGAEQLLARATDEPEDDE